jgi:hypothetical protein
MGSPLAKTLTGSFSSARLFVARRPEPKMMLNACVWVSFIAATAILPAFAIGAIAKLNDWTPKRCYLTTQAVVTGAWMAGWFLPAFAGPHSGHIVPFGVSAFRWVTENPEPPWRLLWIAAPIVAPWVAQRMATRLNRSPK